MQNKKHKFVETLHEVLEDRKYTFRSLGTYVWETKISKKIIPFFKKYYVEDITADTVQKFYDSIRFKGNGEMLSLII